MVRIINAPCGVIALKTWSVIGSDIWRSYGIFKRYSPAGGRSLWPDFETLILWLYLQFSLFSSCVWIKMKFASFRLCCHAMPSLPWCIVVPWSRSQTKPFLLHIAFNGIYSITATKNWYTTQFCFWIYSEVRFQDLVWIQITGRYTFLYPETSQKRNPINPQTASGDDCLRRASEAESRQGRGLQKIQNCFWVKSRSPMTTSARKSYFSRHAFWVLFISLQVWQWGLLLEEMFVSTSHSSWKHL